MGSTHAKKHREEEEAEGGSKPLFNAYFSPARERAYLGPPLEYHFVDTQVTAMNYFLCGAAKLFVCRDCIKAILSAAAKLLSGLH